MFLKLKNLFFVNNYKKLSLRTRYGRLIENEFIGIQYYNVDVSDSLDVLLSPIPERYRKDFYIYTIEANCAISPHIDNNVKTVINFYLNPSNCRTNFYKIREDSESYKVENQTSGSTFKKSSLDLIDGFVAKENEAWLLNVSIPHDIEPLSKELVNRFAITVQTIKYSFDQVKGMLKETDSI
jgi:hypothetical protein